ncbi:hypothetical protein [Albimonas pacifica]|uniref:hypothetical protein n=1 Tax=Albimonas pacifica TaxID=1114924 RepID=UPI0011605808|nr:hypothetical protein [Albimonas pacifica]
MLLIAYWGFAPGGLAAPVVAAAAGLLALAPPLLPAAAAAALAAAGGAALGLSNDLHAPWAYAAWQTLGAALAALAITLAAHGALRLVPARPRPAVAATLGAWAAAAAALGLAFRFASGG